jgi:phosphoglucomutase
MEQSRDCAGLHTARFACPETRICNHRPGWNENCAIGKTIVSSAIIDRVSASLGRKLIEAPVGFKWFVDGLLNCLLGFGGEDSAGASFLRLDGSVWTTDKDGLILGLLAAEMTARTARDPSQIHDDLTHELGEFFYDRLDARATAEQKDILKKLSPAQAKTKELAGDRVCATLSKSTRSMPKAFAARSICCNYIRTHNP